MQTVESERTVGAEQPGAGPATAVTVLVVSVLLGWLGDRLFYHQYGGVNYAIFVALIVAAGLGLLRSGKRPLVAHHTAFGLLAVLFAALLAVRASPVQGLWNGLAMLASLAAFVTYAGERPFLGGSWAAMFVDSLRLALDVVIGPVLDTLDALRWLARAQLRPRRGSLAWRVLRGLLLALPMLLLFAALLGSADVIFRAALGDILDWLLPSDLGSLTEQALFSGALAWLCAAALGAAMLAMPWRAQPAQERKTTSKAPGHGLGLIEAGIVLGSVNALFLAFVAFQARYLFGGKEYMVVRGYTYSEYARRGFFELLAVAILTVLLLIALDRVTRRSERRERLFNGLVALMVVLTMIMLASALLRLKLYDDARGATHLRVMSAVFMLYLAGLLVVLLYSIVARRRDHFRVACAVAAIAFVLTLNVLNLDAFIVRRNAALLHKTGNLDVDYLVSALSEDAIPSLVVLLDDPQVGGQARDTLLQGLRSWQEKLDAQRADRGWPSYNGSVERAWHALDARRQTLSTYTPQ